MNTLKNAVSSVASEDSPGETESRDGRLWSASEIGILLERALAGESYARIAVRLDRGTRGCERKLRRILQQDAECPEHLAEVRQKLIEARHQPPLALRIPSEVEEILHRLGRIERQMAALIDEFQLQHLLAGLVWAWQLAENEDSARHAVALLRTGGFREFAQQIEQQATSIRQGQNRHDRRNLQIVDEGPKDDAEHPGT